MIFLDWLRRGEKTDLETAADITAQLLSDTCKNTDCAPIVPELIEVTESEQNGFMEIIFKEKGNAYSPVLSPADKSESFASGNVFTAGLILCAMVSGSIPDTGNLEMLAGEDIESDEWLSMPHTSLDDLIRKMTALNPEKRFSSEDVFKYLSDKYPGTADILLKEKNTGSDVGRFNIELTGAETVWNPGEGILTGDNKFYPVDKDPVRIPFRLRKTAFEFYVTVNASDSGRVYDLSDSELCFYGIDAGFSSVKICCIGKDGRLSDNILPIPSVAATDNNGNAVYGTEAAGLAKKSGADIIRLFDDELSEDSLTVSSESGRTYSFTHKELIDGFMINLKNEMIKETGFTEDAVTTICFSGGISERIKNLVSDSAKKAGIKAEYISTHTASMLSTYAASSVSDKAVVVSCGCAGTDICLFDGHERLEKSNIHNFSLIEINGFSVGGGAAMTEIISDIILYRLRHQHNLNLYSEENSGLSRAHYRRNRRELFRVSESIKTHLSFEEEVTEKAEFYSEGMKDYEFTVTRKEYENKISSIAEKITEGLDSSVKTDGCRKNQITELILTGGASVTPLVREKLKQYFSDTDCHINYDYNIMRCAEGAAVYSVLRDELRDDEIKRSLDHDLGYAVLDSVKGIPVFKLLVPADTQYDNGKIAVSYRYKCDSRDIKNRSGELKIYTRERGNTDTDSLYDSGGIIKYSGKIRFDIPEKFSMDNDRVKLDMIIDNTDNISVTAVYEKKSSVIGGVIGKIIRKGPEDNELKASYEAKDK